MTLLYSCAAKPELQPQDAGRVVFLIGKAELQEDVDSWKPLKTGELVPARMSVRTGPGAKLDLQYATGSLRLLENTTLSAEFVSAHETALDVKGGNILAKVRKLEAGERFNVRTPTVVAGVRGTEFWGQVPEDRNRGTFAVRDGIVEVESIASKKKVVLKKGEAVDISKGEVKSRKAASAELGAMEQIAEMPAAFDPAGAAPSK